MRSTHARGIVHATVLVVAGHVLAVAASGQIVPVKVQGVLRSPDPLAKSAFAAVEILERLKPPKDHRERAFIMLSAGVYAAAALDMHESASLRPNFVEYDPLAKPFTHVSTPAYYIAGIALATGVNRLAWKMARSERWRKASWVPQVCSIVGNTIGFITTKRNE